MLLVSTDPASNLDEVLETPLGAEPRPVAGVDGLDAANVDPEAAAREYRERLVGPYRGVLPDAAVRSMEESLSGACTVEIAAFDEFTRLLADAEATRAYDHVVFDTAPTGHTLRLLSLPAAWTEFIDQNTTGTSCLGPLAGLERQRALYAESVARRSPTPTAPPWCWSRAPEPSRPGRGRAHGRRARRRSACTDSSLVLNGVFTVADDADAHGAAAWPRVRRRALAGLTGPLAALDRAWRCRCTRFALLGVVALAAVLDPGRMPGPQPGRPGVDRRRRLPLDRS